MSARFEPAPTRLHFTRLLAVTILAALGLALFAGTGAMAQGLDSTKKLTVIPTGAERAQSLRINTGRKAHLSDGSYNTVYEQKKPRTGHGFIRVFLDVAVENTYWSAQADRFEVRNAEDPMGPAFAPVDWFRDDGLLEERAQSIMIRNLASFEVTFEVPTDGEADLSVWVGGLFVGTLADLLAIRPSLGQ